VACKRRLLNPRSHQKKTIMTRCAFLGRSTLDLLYFVHGYPEENTKLFAGEFVQQSGGPALNAAITFAQLGGTATLFSAVGKSAFGRFVKEELAAHDVILRDVAAGTEFLLPVCSVAVNRKNGSRTVLNPTLIEPEVAPLSADCADSRDRLVLVDGFLVPALGEVLKSYASRGAEICMDSGSWKPVTPSLLGLCSIAIVGERFLPPGTDTVSSVIDFLHEHGVGKVAVTRGLDSIIGSESGRRFEVEVEPIHAVDTLGAGDVLHGAFCWYYGESGDFQKALQQASRIATLSCGSLGARAWRERLNASVGV
jgi:sugar/nucleoside kinase (ribokinase family)